MPSNRLAEASFAHQRRGHTLRRVLPRPVRRALRFSYFLALDGLDRCLGRHRDLVPPRWLNPVGDGDFENTGNEFLDYFIRLGGLQPSHAVLEVGCGIGRMARPLTRYLTTGTYEGFDIIPSGIQWCQKNITTRYPNFRFVSADIYNQEYNPRGRVRASEYRFPYPDRRFDFAFLTSVFTHIPSADAEHYLSELSRVLGSSRTCLATFFLLNDESRQLISAGRSSLRFSCPISGCWTTDPKIAEAAVAYEETRIAEVLRGNGLQLESVSYGRWCGRTEYLSYQDVLVFRKT